MPAMEKETSCFTQNYRGFGEHSEHGNLPRVVPSTAARGPGQTVRVRSCSRNTFAASVWKESSIARYGVPVCSFAKTGAGKQKHGEKKRRKDNEKWKRNFKDVRAGALSEV